MKKLFSLSTLLAIAGAAGAGALLFWTSQSVQQAEDKLSRLQKAVANETQAIRVLSAEWDYLNRPARLEALAAEHLGLSSGMVVVTDIAGLPDIFAPALPQSKPVLEAQPVSLQIPPGFGEDAGVTPVPRSKPPYKESQSFDALLSDLNREGGAP